MDSRWPPEPDHDFDFDLNADDQVVDGGSPQQLTAELNRQLRLHRVQQLRMTGGEAVEGAGEVVGSQAG